MEWLDHKVAFIFPYLSVTGCQHELGHGSSAEPVLKRMTAESCPCVILPVGRDLGYTSRRWLHTLPQPSVADAAMHGLSCTDLQCGQSSQTESRSPFSLNHWSKTSRKCQGVKDHHHPNLSRPLIADSWEWINTLRDVVLMCVFNTAPSASMWDQVPVAHCNNGVNNLPIIGHLPFCFPFSHSTSVLVPHK